MKNTAKVILLTIFVILFSALALSSCGPLQVFCSHSYSDWEVTVKPDCQSFGERQRVCSICGVYDFEEIPMLEHEEVWVVDVEPTCKEPGKGHMECANCGDNWDHKDIPAKEHKESEIKTTEPTCFEDGMVYTECLYCGRINVIEWIISNLYHTSDEWIIDLEPTCDSYGYKHKECTVCGESFDRTEIKMLSHSYNDKELCVLCGCTNEKYFIMTDNGIAANPAYDFLPSEIVIPASFEGRPVNNVAAHGFSNRTELWSVYFAGDVIEIKDGAFYGCTYLSSIVLPESLVSIDDFAFAYCGNLDGIIIPKSVVTIETYAFSECYDLSWVSFAEGSELRRIEQFAFYGCHKVYDFRLPDSIYYIGESAFFGTGYYNTEENWTDGVLYIDNYLIKASEALSGEYTVKDGVTVIGSCAFLRCANLTSIVIPDSVLHLGDMVFAYCENLADVKLSENVQTFSYAVFNRCVSLAEITIPASLEEMGDSTFYACENLETVVFAEGSKLRTISWGTFHECKNLKNVSLPENLTSIGNSAFMSCKSLTTITLPENVNHIGDSAFECCGALTEITLPDGVTYLGMSAFADCISLTRVDLSTYLTGIESNTFFGCTSLTTITIPQNISYICSFAFAESGLTEITIPDTVYTIYDRAFFNCRELASITIEDIPDLDLRPIVYEEYYIRSIGEDAFAGTKYYETEENWVDSVLYIGDYVIACDGLATGDLTIKEGVITIADCAFEASDYTSITLPDSLRVIGYKAFYYSSFLKSVNIAGNITHIPHSAFSHCHSLKNVVISGSVQSIENEAFYYCKSLETITIPKGVSDIGSNVFLGCDSLVSIIFEDSGDWHVKIESEYHHIDLSDPAEAANYFRFTYCANEWTKYFAEADDE